MPDANGTRHHLLLGYADWASCRGADGAPLRESWEASPPAVNASALEWDGERGELRLERKVFRFAPKEGDNPPSLSQRRGAAMDVYGNRYWIGEDRLSILVWSSGAQRVSFFWPLEDTAVCARPAHGDFQPLAPAEAPPARVYSGLAVTDDHYLVAGVLDPPGLEVFDLHAGGAPRELVWPAEAPFTPFDLSPRPGGGVWVLDRERRRLWALDGQLRIVPASGAGAPAGGFRFLPLPGGAEEAAAHAPAFDWARAPLALAAADPIAVEGLPDCSVLVLDRAPGDSFSSIWHYGPEFAGSPPLSFAAVLSEIEEDARAAFRLEAHDFVFLPEFDGIEGTEYDRLFVVSSEGNQAFAFRLERTPAGVRLRALESYFPLRLFSGMGLMAGRRKAWYDFAGNWIPVVEQLRPRYALAAEFTTPAFDGKEPGAVWHRLMLDACVPPHASVRVWSAAAEQAAQLESPLWDEEPSLYRRARGSEQPFAPGYPAGALSSSAAGTWELLFQKARGRFLRLKIRLEADGRTTPRLRALRAYYPRFSYLRYLPAIYREDPVSASFLERYLANAEGFFTALEDQIVAAQVLFDPRTAPAGALEWLASWLGVTLDPAWDEVRRRLFLRHAITFFQWRGTLRGLTMALRLALDECPDESIFTDPMRRGHAAERIRIVERFRARRGMAAAAGDPTGGAPAPTALDRAARWRAFLARRYGRVSELNRAWASSYPSFDAVPLPASKPAQAAAREDFGSFERMVIGYAPEAHRFTVLAPAPRAAAPGAAAYAARLALVRRIVELEKPAHAAYDLRFYWSLFRVGEARLGLDTEIDLGSRSPALMSAAVLGYAHLAESYLAPSPPQDALNRQVVGRDALNRSAAFRQEKQS